MRYFRIAILVLALLWACRQYGGMFSRRLEPHVVEAPHYTPRSFAKIARDIAPSVVAIESTIDGSPPGINHKRTGSGLIIDPDGIILTNRHLVEGAAGLEVILPDGRRYCVRYCRLDKDMDIALVKIDASGLPAAAMGSSSGLKVGQWAIACGNPFSSLVAGSSPAISVGVISGLNRNLAMEKGCAYRNLIQTDAAINLGNSGGPLLDLYGRVVGITAAIVSASGAGEGMGFAIPIDDIIPRLEMLKRKQHRLRI